MWYGFVQDDKEWFKIQEISVPDKEFTEVPEPKHPHFTIDPGLESKL